ncbi:MAG: hypothetical protein KAS04_00610, partial [Candidatus Aenigmarchaeota archaeon]|nr:hypothetical protein [Candidatus Aenigmarchaeota archaeon]
MKENASIWVVLLVLVSFIALAVNPLSFTGFFVSVESGEMNLTLWDNTHAKGGSFNVYASGSPQGSGPSATTLARFFTNYTNTSSGNSINGSNIECNISINLSSGWTTPVNTWFNDTSLLYVYNYTFDSRSNYSWNVTCFGTPQGYGTLGTLDNITITNTPAGIYVPLVDKVCYEDTTCNHTFATDCYDIDDID